MTASLTLTGGISSGNNSIKYIFSTCLSDRIDMPADITDQYVEDNTSVQDHMALPPLTFTLKGLVAEKVFNSSLYYTDKIIEATSKLQPISALVPTLSSYMQTVVSVSSYIEDSYNRYYQNINDLKNLISKNQVQISKNQTEVVNTLRKIRDARVLVSVSNDFGTFPNCLIQNAYLDQSQSEDFSKVVVELKEFRGVSTQLVKIDYDAYSSRYAQQMAAEENLGKVQGKQELSSTLYRITIGQ